MSKYKYERGGILIMRMTMEQIANMNRGGGVNYFKLNSGETAQVRFLYNGVADVPYYQVHEAMLQTKRPIYINCGIESEMDTMDACKWCKENFPLRVRIPIVLYNENTKQIEFWVRTRKWFEGNALPILNMLPTNVPIVSQVYNVSRTGTNMQNTNYVLSPLGTPDNKTLQDFGDIPDVIQSGVFRASDYTLPVGAYNPNAMQNMTQQQPTSYMQQPQQSYINNNFNMQQSQQQSQMYNNGYVGDVGVQQQINPSASNNVFGNPQQQGPAFAPRRTTQVF